jgi:RHS repeat-associated protein
VAIDTATTIHLGFGAGRNLVGSADARYMFTGKERDIAETGYDYFGARYYDSWSGRFSSMDPHASSYPGLSPFNYAAGNPIVFVDPNGMDLTDYRDESGKLIEHKDDGSNAVFQLTSFSKSQTDLSERKKYFKFTGFSDQGGKNEINSIATRAWVQAYIVNSPIFSEGKNTYCNLAVQSMINTELSMHGEPPIDPGNANATLNGMSTINGFHPLPGQDDAVVAASRGFLTVVGWNSGSDDQSGHVATLSISPNPVFVANVGPKQWSGFVRFSKAFGEDKRGNLQYWYFNK